jgi:hypothetical protein
MTFFRRNITIGRASIDKCDREALESENCHDHHHKNKWASHFRQAVLIRRSRPMVRCISVPKVLIIFAIASVCIVIGIKAFTSMTVASFRFFTSTQSDLNSEQPTMRSSISLNPYWTEAEIFTSFFCSRMSNYIEDARIANKQILLDLLTN